MNDGAIVGKFKVAISAIVQPNGGPGLPEDAIKGDAAPISLIPDFYGNQEQSGLTAMVEDKKNKIDFDLVRKK